MCVCLWKQLNETPTIKKTLEPRGNHGNTISIPSRTVLTETTTTICQIQDSRRTNCSSLGCLDGLWDNRPWAQTCKAPPPHPKTPRLKRHKITANAFACLSYCFSSVCGCSVSLCGCFVTVIILCLFVDIFASLVIFMSLNSSFCLFVVLLWLFVASLCLFVVILCLFVDPDIPSFIIFPYSWRL